MREGGEKRRESESSPEVKLAVTFAMPDFLIDPSKQLAHFVLIAGFGCLNIDRDALTGATRGIMVMGEGELLEDEYVH